VSRQRDHPKKVLDCFWARKGIERIRDALNVNKPCRVTCMILNVALHTHQQICLVNVFIVYEHYMSSDHNSAMYRTVFILTLENLPQNDKMHSPKTIRVLVSINKLSTLPIGSMYGSVWYIQLFSRKINHM